MAADGCGWLRIMADDSGRRRMAAETDCGRSLAAHHHTPGILPTGCVPKQPASPRPAPPRPYDALMAHPTQGLRDRPFRRIRGGRTR
jgi:hypothetical protein